MATLAQTKRARWSFQVQRNALKEEWADQEQKYRQTRKALLKDQATATATILAAQQRLLAEERGVYANEVAPLSAGTP